MRTRHISITGLALAVTAVLLTFYYFGGTCNAMDIFIRNIFIVLEVAGITAVFGVFLLLKSRQEKHARLGKVLKSN